MHYKDMLYSLKLLDQTIVTVCWGGECHHGANLNYGLPAPQQTGITVWSWSKLELGFGHRPLQLELQFGHEADLEFISPRPRHPLN